MLCGFYPLKPAVVSLPAKRMSYNTGLWRSPAQEQFVKVGVAIRFEKRSKQFSWHTFLLIDMFC